MLRLQTTCVRPEIPKFEVGLHRLTAAAPLAICFIASRVRTWRGVVAAGVPPLGRRSYVQTRFPATEDSSTITSLV